MVPGSYRANSVGLFTVSMAAGRPYFVLSDHCIVLEAVLLLDGQCLRTNIGV